MSGNRTFLARLCGLAAMSMLATGAAQAGVVSLWDGTGSNDTTSWAGLGGDGTVIPSPFSATSAAGNPVTGSFAGGTGLVAVQCPASPSCSWTGGFPAGDTLVWAFDAANAVGTGPVTLALGNPVLAGGVELQSDSVVQFTAQVEAFAGATPLGSASITSDPAGDPVFIGIQDTVAEITSLVFSMTSCGGDDCADFAMDSLITKNAVTPPPPTPEPASLFLLGSALAAMGLRNSRRSRKRRAGA
jgi:hypothetical protein